jgi:hypothetical protein
MAMLERIKKKQWEGFKDFVESLESSTAQHRQFIMLNGVLEDPLFMRWVMKNLKTFPDLLALSSDQIEDILRSNESMVSVLAKALPVASVDELQTKYGQLCPRQFSKLKDEFSYLQEVSEAQRESAQIFLMKAVRKMQKEERLEGFRWNLPPRDVFFEKGPKEGLNSITFEDGTLAATGEMFKGKRIGKWQHFYDNGRLLAEGQYQEGNKTGSWQFFYGNGKKKAEGKYLADVRHGRWIEWDRDGVLSECDWVEGKRQNPS